MSIFDFDDFHETNHRYDLLHKLKEINPKFCCTLFAVPALGSADFWDAVPDWCELVVHGWLHPDPYECSAWSYERMQELMDVIDDEHPWFERGFKAPGWQISDAVYAAVEDRGWWLADQHLEDGRRPPGIPTYFYEDDPENRWHGHVQDWGSNGINETWGELSARVAVATDFQFCSEALS